MPRERKQFLACQPVEQTHGAVFAAREHARSGRIAGHRIHEGAVPTEAEEFFPIGEVPLANLRIAIGPAAG